MLHQVRHKKKQGFASFKKNPYSFKSITGQYISVKAVLKNLIQGKIVLPIAAYYVDFNIGNGIGQ